MQASRTGLLGDALLRVKGVEQPAGPSLAEQGAQDLESLRLGVKEKLMQATLTGDLADMLQESAPHFPMETEEPESKPDQDMEMLRQEARSTLMQASRSGRIGEALLLVKKAEQPAAQSPEEQGGEDLEPFRLEVKEKLMQASLTGDLSDLLHQLAPHSLLGTEDPGRKRDQDMEMLRQEAKSALMQASRTGLLGDALLRVKGVEQPAGPSLAEQDAQDVEMLRQEAKHALVQASKAGCLGDALLRVKGVEQPAQSPASDELVAPKEPPAESLNDVPTSGLQVDQDLEVLRSQARSALVQASLSGRISDVLQEIRGGDAPMSSAELDRMKQQLRDALDRAASSHAAALVAGDAIEAAEDKVRLIGDGMPSGEDAVTEAALDADEIESAKEKARMAMMTALLSGEVAGEVAEGDKAPDVADGDKVSEPSLNEDEMERVKETVRKALVAVFLHREEETPSDSAHATSQEGLPVIAKNAGAPQEMMRSHDDAHAAPAVVTEQIAPVVYEETFAPIEPKPKVHDEIVVTEAPTATASLPKESVAPQAEVQKAPVAETLPNAAAAEALMAQALRARLDFAKQQMSEYNAVLKEEVSLLNEDLATLIAKRDALRTQRDRRAP